MTTKIFDSTVSQLLQDNSSVEYVAPETNPIATIQTDVESRTKLSDTSLFDFHAVHNGEHCIASLDPKDRGTERQFRFTRALLCTLLGVKSENTITNHIDALINRGVVNDVKNLTSLNIKNENGNGAVKTTLYDLTVFNHLVMRLDTDKAWAMKEKFNDVLIKHETQVQPELTDAEIMSRALEIAHRTLALREERIKALTAERDEAVRTKTQYQSNLAAQMSGRVGGLTSALNRVRTENDRLKGDIFTVDDVYIIMNISDVSFTHKDPKAVIRDSLNLFSKEMGEPFPKVPLKQKEINGKMVDISGYTYTTKTVQAYFEFVEANPLGWQARNRKMIMYGWLREKLIPSI